MKTYEPLVVLVTGAGKGAGRLAAEAFASRGDRVALNDIAPNRVEAMLEDWRARGWQGKAYVEDVSRRLSAWALIQQVLEDWGPIDVLINHAAVEPSAPLLRMDEWDWQRTLEVNLTGVFMMTQLVGREMAAQKQGVIINLLSLDGREGKSNRSAYLTTQMGLVGFTRQAALELADSGVRVHAVGKGLARFQNEEGHFPHDLAGAILYLCSSKAADLNGIIVDLE